MIHLLQPWEYKIVIHNKELIVNGYRTSIFFRDPTAHEIKTCCGLDIECEIRRDAALALLDKFEQPRKWSGLIRLKIIYAAFRDRDLQHDTT